MPELNDPVEGPIAYDVIARGLPQTLIKKSNDAQIDIYVDPVAGSDTNLGTLAAPIRTLLQADTLIPLVIDVPIFVHLKGVTYDLPVRGYWLRSRILRQPLRVFADESWDASVYTIVEASRTAAAGTDQSKIVDSVGGISVNVWKNKTLEMTSGAASGYRQDIIENTATDVVVSAGFDTALNVAVPVATDTYRVFDADGCILRAPAGGPAGGRYQLSQPMLCGPGDRAQSDGLSGGALIFEGFRLESVNESTTWGEFGVHGDTVCMYGVTGTTSLETIPLYNERGHLLLGAGAAPKNFNSVTGLAVYQKARGWGFRCEDRAPFPESGTLVRGFLNMEVDGADMQMATRSSYEILGGRLGRFLTGGHGVNIDVLGEMSGNKQARPISEGADAINLTQNGGRCHLQRFDGRGLVAPITLSGGGSELWILGVATVVSHTTPGQPVIDVQNGGRLYMIGSPAGIGAGGGATDWEIDGVPFDPLVDLPSAGSVKTGTKGSFIFRI